MTQRTFISHAWDEDDVALVLCDVLESSNVPCWIAPRDLTPGTNWGDSVNKAVKSSRAHVLLLSRRANKSSQILREVDLAAKNGIPIFVVRIENVLPSFRLRDVLPDSRSLNALDSSGRSNVFRELARSISSALPSPVSSEPTHVEESPKEASKGYVFISYVSADRAFVERLGSLLQERKYAYWDYLRGDRDYHAALYQELEERIENAVAFLCIVSDQWRDSEWGAAEYTYARDAGVPVFIIQAAKLQKPMPLILNLQTRIDMSEDFERGTAILHRELKRKGL